MESTRTRSEAMESTRISQHHQLQVERVRGICMQSRVVRSHNGRKTSEATVQYFVPHLEPHRSRRLDYHRVFGSSPKSNIGNMCCFCEEALRSGYTAGARSSLGSYIPDTQPACKTPNTAEQRFTASPDKVCCNEQQRELASETDNYASKP